ncbi:peptidase M23 [Synechococcus phage ACG-2014f]|uniref:Lysozyme n=1 Tax=Synechococcus phage ACG-2014f TaxID=1493511 RepID=A0A0E3HHG9_9CAUD|nr:peptidase M23 [Synechococcus phage ACG-2014f]AIX28578.1 peptidase M23 [Synechococcus phage ACG-2014f]AIX30200.1 peptidase M23 [Synechococcus phage ACG-2014f]AIX32212.1 peptidase M23 [Synechococcus phage ACG-2014f]AIX45562.1 peptidase M23 [Synechococcus phage ACG-2014f]
MAQPQIAANKTKALRIGQRLMVGAKSFGKGVRNSVDTSQQVITQSARKIKSDQKRINTENRKQQRFEEAVREETERRQKSLTKGAYGVGSAAKKLTEKVVVDPMKAIWNIIAAWAIKNLPTIVDEVRKFVKKVRIVIAAINNAFRATGNLFKGWLSYGQAWLTNMVTFDWGDSTGRLEDAQAEIDNSYDELDASWNTIYNVWGKEEEELDKMLTWLDSGKTVKQATDAITQGIPLPQTPAFGDGSREGGGGYGGSGIQMSADEQQLTESLIAGEEGVRTKAYQDSEGIWTIGYGQTRINGRAVRPGDTITKAQALSGFRGALAEHQQRAINQLGEERWSQLDARSRAVLTSITYNYGSIPGRVLPAAKTGNAEDIAVAMNSLYGDNRGVLKGRRQREQSILRGGTSSYLDKDFMAGGQFAGSGTGPLVMGGGNESSSGSISSSGGTTNTTAMKKGDMVGGFSVSSAFGRRAAPTAGASSNHGGLDIATPQGTYLAFDVDVEIMFAGSAGGYGYVIDAWSASLGIQFRCAHMSVLMCNPGQKVRAGTAVGRTGGAVGSRGAGTSTGPHLHFEVSNQKGSANYGGSNSASMLARYAKHLILSSSKPQPQSLRPATVSSSSQQTANQLNSSASSRRTNGRRTDQKIILIKENTIIK